MEAAISRVARCNNPHDTIVVHHMYAASTEEESLLKKLFGCSLS
jgi:hypothetical protein